MHFVTLSFQTSHVQQPKPAVNFQSEKLGWFSHYSGKAICGWIDLSLAAAYKVQYEFINGY